jgi:hypothetical protein
MEENQNDNSIIEQQDSRNESFSSTTRKSDEYDKLEKIINDYKLKLEALYNSDILQEQYKGLVEAKIQQLSSERDLSKFWLHLHIIKFYIYIYLRDNASQSNKPIIVSDEHFVICCNEIAEGLGIKIGTTIIEAKKLCDKDLIILKQQNQLYKVW